MSTLATQSGKGVKITDEGSVKTVDNQSDTNEGSISDSGSVADYTGSKVTGTTSGDANPTGGSASSSGGDWRYFLVQDCPRHISLWNDLGGSPIGIFPRQYNFMGSTGRRTGYSTTINPATGASAPSQNAMVVPSNGSQTSINLADLGLASGDYSAMVQGTGTDS